MGGLHLYRRHRERNHSSSGPRRTQCQARPLQGLQFGQPQPRERDASGELDRGKFGEAGHPRVHSLARDRRRAADHADVSLAKAELGYEPTTSLRTGIANFVEWYKTYYADGLDADMLSYKPL